MPRAAGPLNRETTPTRDDYRREQEVEGLQKSVHEPHIATPHQETHLADPKGLVGNVKSFVGDKWHALTHPEPLQERVQIRTQPTQVGPVTPTPVVGAERAWRAGLRPARGDPDMAVATDEEEALADRTDQFLNDAPLGLQEVANAEEIEWLHQHGARGEPIFSSGFHWPVHHGHSFEDRHRATAWDRERERVNQLRDEREQVEREARFRPEGAEYIDDIVAGAPVRRLAADGDHRMFPMERYTADTANEAEKARLLANAPPGAQLVEDIVAGAPRYRLAYPQELEHVPLRDRLMGHELQTRRLEQRRLNMLSNAPAGATVVEEINAGAPMRRLAMADDQLSWSERWLGRTRANPVDAPTITTLPLVDDIVAGAPVVRRHAEPLLRKEVRTVSAYPPVSPASIDQPALPRGAVLARANDATTVVQDRIVEVPESKSQGFMHWPSFLGGGNKQVEAVKANLDKDAQWARAKAEEVHDKTLKKIEADVEHVKRETERKAIQLQHEVAADARRAKEEVQKMEKRVVDDTKGFLSGMRYFVSDKWDAFTHHGNEAPHLTEDRNLADRAARKLDEKSWEAERKSVQHSIFGESKRAQLRETEANVEAKTSSALKSVQTDHTGRIGTVEPKKGWLSGLRDIPDDEISLMTL